MTRPSDDDSVSLRVDVDGGRLYGESRGRGVPILMIHGWSLDHRSFAPQASLADRFRVITFDRRGFGASDAPPDLRRETDDIDCILDTLSIPTVHLLGVSQGGRIALRYAVTRGPRLRSLILQGAMVDGVDIHDTGKDRIPLEDYVSLARAGRMHDVRSRWLEHPVMTLCGGGEDARRLLARIVGDYAGRDLLDHQPAWYEFGAEPLDAIAAFARPVLLVTGAAETPARKEHARHLLARAPDCREIVMPESGHLANIEESSAFNDAVAAFCVDADRRLRRSVR